jgi:hypothetical protein
MRDLGFVLIVGCHFHATGRSLSDGGDTLVEGKGVG